MNPFMGDVVAAVDRYADIPGSTRDKLKARMAKRDYDEIVSIKRGSISGKADYGADITEMYFGQGSICKTVTRAKWTDAMEERGLVYCEDGQCILVPTVCRNVSRIRRIGPRPIAAIGGTTPPATPAEVPPETELLMDPTGAGPLAAGAPGASPTSFAQLAGPSLESGLPTNPGSLLPSVGPAGAGPVLGLPAVPVLPPGSVTTVPPVVTPPDGTTVVPVVPEPSTWALLLSGVGVLAFVARRRRIR